MPVESAAVVVPKVLASKIASGNRDNRYRVSKKAAYLSLAFKILDLIPLSIERGYAKPPFTRRICPFTQPPSGLARKDTTLATSSG
jgi:hypothetical protein